MSVKDKVEAIDRFVRTLKSGSVYDDINAACIMAGWTNLAGALTPLKGAAPTNGGGLFQDADLDPGIGLKGNGSSKYLDSNRAENADPQNDAHISAFSSSPAGSGPRVSIGSQFSWIASDDVSMYFRRNSNASASIAVTNATGFLGAARADASGIGYRVNGAAYNYAAVSRIPSSTAINVFRHPISAQYNDATLSWYSIGSATDLAALDSAVSTLMEDLRAIDEQGFDRDALAYIRAVEAADGAYLETGVKKAINRFIVGLKKDNLWDAIKASCILCGARTIAGALVPLAGTAPTAYNFTSAQYNRETGLIGVPASNTYIDTNRANNADGQDSQHMAVYVSTLPATTGTAVIGNYSASGGKGSLMSVEAANAFGARSNSTALDTSGTVSQGLCAINRQLPNEYQKRVGGISSSASAASASPTSITHTVFALNGDSAVFGPYKTNARLAFYSVGSSLSLSALDSRVTTLVSEIAAAIP